MLLGMKAYVEGMRSFVYYVGQCLDREALAAGEAEKARYKGFGDLLTPLVKAYCAQRGFDVCVTALQVYGGYGYIKEYPVEQLVRDCKITSIYEGTDGIQAMDLLRRKLGMVNGRVFMNFPGGNPKNHCNGKGNKRIGRINRRSREGRQSAGGGRPAHRQECPVTQV